MTEDKILEAANELAGLKAYNPDTQWTFEELRNQIAEILRKHNPKRGRRAKAETPA